MEHRCLIVAAIAAALPIPLSAQQSQDSPIPQVVVTAQKRESVLQDVPFSVAALSDDQLRERGATNIVELARNVAGLSITDLGPGQSQVAIRGISAGQVIRDQPGVKEQVGVYLDESPISVALFTPDLDLFDLDRFEVLRGPQGTLFGAGSLAGTLRYITRAPEVGEFDATAELRLSDGTDSEFGGSIRGMVNLPMGDTAALRIVGYHSELPGFIDAFQPGGVVREDVDSGERSGGRIALLWEANENLTVMPRVIYQNLDTDGFPRVDIYNILGNPFTTTEPAVNLGERDQFIQLEEGLQDNFRLADLRIDYVFGPTTLTSISSYTDRDVLVTRDATQLTGSVSWDLGVPEAVRLSSALLDDTELQAFSQEIRLASNTDEQSAWQWLVGAFYQDVDRRYGQTLPTPGWDAVTGIDNTELNAPADSPYFSRLRYDFRQFAVFGEATYRFAPQWSLTGGVRYFDFEEDRVLIFAGAFADVTDPAGVPGEVSSDGVSPRAILSFEPTEDFRIDLQAARGFRLGGINDPINIPLCSPEDIPVFGNRPTWEDETVWNYELGTKTRFQDGRVLLNVAAFYSDIEDLQATTVAGTCSSRIVFNVPKARSMGVEAELFARPNERWDFGVSATWVDAELRSTVTSTSAEGVTQVVGGLEKGNRLPTSPEFQAAASITYMQPVLTYEGFVNFTFQHVGSSYTQIADQAEGAGVIPDFITFGNPTIDSFTFDPKLPDYQIGNLRFGVRAERWEVAAFVENLWDERALLSLDNERGFRARVGFLTNRPRTYGVSLRRSF